MSVPGERLCLELLAKYQIHTGIIEHSRLVADVAVFLAEALRRSAGAGVDVGVEVDIEVDLVRAGALLHDIGKTKLLAANSNHAEAGARIVEKEGHGELVEVIRRHQVDAVLEPARKLRTWEEKIVFYTDKLVTREVLPLEERFADLRKRYPKLVGLFDLAEPRVRQLEAEIFANLDFTPDELVRQFA